MKCHSCFKSYKKNELKFYSNNNYCLECLNGVLESEGKSIDDAKISNVSTWKFLQGYISLLIGFLFLCVFPWFISVLVLLCIIVYNIIDFYKQKKQLWKNSIYKQMILRK